MTTTSPPPVGEPVLDAVKRQLILDLATEGLSRRAIARIVGCAPSTITRTARRDPGFGVELALAEETLARNALQTLGWAVQQGKYWRAAGWVAERLMPERFARRRPEQRSPDETDELMRQLGSALLQTTPVDDRRATAERIATVLNELTADEDRFAADDFDAEAEPSAEPPIPPLTEAGVTASSPAKTPIVPPVGTSEKPSVQHAPQQSGDSRSTPRVSSALREAASALLDRPMSVADLLGRCTGAPAADGLPGVGVGLQARPNGKHRQPK